MVWAVLVTMNLCVWTCCPSRCTGQNGALPITGCSSVYRDAMACNRCPNNSYYEFIPVHMGTAMPNGHSSWSASCFQDTKMQLAMNPGNVGGVVTFTVSNESSVLCSDVYVLVDNFKMRLIELSTLSANREVAIADWEPNELVSPSDLICALPRVVIGAFPVHRHRRGCPISRSL